MPVARSWCGGWLHDQPACDLLSGPNFGVLSTVMPDGSPQSATVWVDVDADHALIPTEKHSLKYRNILRDPRVALTVSAHDDPYREINLRGRVLKILDNGGGLCDRLSAQYYGVTPTPTMSRARSG